MTDVDQFENVIVKTGNNGEVTRVRDVGRVELGAQTYSQTFTLDGKPAAGIGIYQSPGANALDVEHGGQGQDGASWRGNFRKGSPIRPRSTRRCSSTPRSTRSTRR